MNSRHGGGGRLVQSASKEGGTLTRDRLAATQYR